VFGLVTVDIYKTFGDSRENLDHETYLTEVASISCIFNSFRFAWSTALDHHSYKKVYGTLLCIQIVLAFTYSIAAKSRILYAIWVWFSIWCESGHFTLIPNILKCIYGKQATSLYGVAFSYVGITCLIMVFMLPTALGHDYIIFWMVTGFMSITALLMLMFLFKQEKFKVFRGPITSQIDEGK